MLRLRWSSASLHSGCAPDDTGARAGRTNASGATLVAALCGGCCRLDDVQAAFRLIEAGPAAGTGVLTGSYCTGAVGAADARVVLIMKSVVGYVVIVDVAPDLLG